MKLGFITDTHENKVMVQRSVELFNGREVDMVVHGGDMVAPFTAKLYAELKMPFHFHIGNNDGEVLFLKETVESFNGMFHMYDFTLEEAGKSILIQHEPTSLEALAASGVYDAILYGHTHDLDMRSVGDTLILNPGESCTWLRGNAMCAILDLQTMQVELIDLQLV